MGAGEIIKILEKYGALTVGEIVKKCESGRSSVTQTLRRLWIHNELERKIIRKGRSYTIKYWIK